MFFRFRVIAGLGLLALSPNTWADSPVRIKTSLDLGYDDNPAQRSCGEPRGFIRYGFDAGWESAPNDNRWLLDIQGRYQDYEGGGDNHRLGVALGWARSLDGGKAAFSLTLDGVRYRDHLVAADERDELGATLEYQQLASAKLDFRVSAEFRWLGYRNASLPWAGRPGGATGNGFGSPPSTGMGLSPATHDDQWRALAVEVGYYPHPDVELALRAHYGGLDSSSAAEEYGQYGGGLFLVYRVTPDVTLALNLDGYDRRYEQGRIRPEREDRFHTLGLRLQRGWDDMTFHLGLTRTENDSGIRQQTFQQTVVESGVAWHF